MKQATKKNTDSVAFDIQNYKWEIMTTIKVDVREKNYTTNQNVTQWKRNA